MHSGGFDMETNYIQEFDQMDNKQLSPGLIVHK